MGYLGLSEAVEKQDNLLQRLFWPGDHAGEVDSLGQQGFWICAFVALSSSVVLFIQGHWFIAVLTFAFFFLGGIGVREHSMPAAIVVALAYLLNQVANLLMGLSVGVMGPAGLINVAATVLLIANIRGTWIAARWAKLGDPEAFPERMNETWKDRMVDQMPRQVWPRMRVPFLFISGLYLLLVVLGTGMAARNAFKVSLPNQQAVPERTIQVAPSR